MSRSLRLTAVLLALLVLTPGCRPAPPADPASDFLARRPFPAPPDTLTSAGAYGRQAALVEALIPTLGPVIGYKAGLTTSDAQARFGVNHPVLGTLLRDMIRPSGDTVRADFGVRPLFEGDLLVRVGSDAVNEAETDEALLAALDAVLPFLELPDLLYAPDVPLDARALTAANVGARLGIAGDPLLLSTLDDPYARLGAMRVTLYDDAGTTLAEGDGAALLGHPLHVVRWIRDAVRAEGRRLRPGMLLSLGSLTPLLPVRAGRTITARYEGLTADPVSVTVTFGPAR